MRIAIDIQSVVGNRAGVGQYTFCLVNELARLNQENEIVLFYFNFLGRFKGLYFENNKIKNRVIRFLPGRAFNLLWKKFDFPRIDWLAGGVELFHFPNFVIRPIDKQTKAVVTIYDLSFRRFPQYTEPKNLLFLNRQIPRTLKRADKIIAVSRFTQDELIKLYNIQDEKIEVIYGGVDGAFREIDDRGRLDEVRRRYNLPSHFILWAGTLEPRKNVPGLIKAYRIFKKSFKTDIDYKLVLAGMKGWLYEGIFQTVKDLNLEDDIVFTGYVPNGNLPHLYNTASVFVFPSFYEGFGLPPLEAMACGVPVITSNTASLPEVVGDGGKMVDPYSPEELARAMEDVLSDGDLRRQMVLGGLKQVRKFTWRKAAEQTLRVYEEVLSTKK